MSVMLVEFENKGHRIKPRERGTWLTQAMERVTLDLGVEPARPNSSPPVPQREVLSQNVDTEAYR